MWKPILVLIATSIISVCAFVESPKEEAQIFWNVINENVENNKYISLIVTGVTTVVWVFIYLMMRRMAPTPITVSKLQELLKPIVDQPLEVEESPIIARTKARLLQQRLNEELMVLENRIKWIPEQLTIAKEELGNAKKAEEKILSDLSLATERRVEAEGHLKSIEETSQQFNKEIRAIRNELTKLEVSV